MDKQLFERERKIVIATMVITGLYFLLLFEEEPSIFLMTSQVISFILSINILNENNDLAKIKKNLVINAILSVLHLNFLNMRSEEF